MNARTALLVAMTSLVLQIATPAVVPDLEKSEEGDEETERIINGQDAKDGDFPWVAALYRYGEYICTCSIIGKTSVMTAAHCVEDEEGDYYSAGIFHAIVHVNRSSPVHKLTFSNMTVHPNYNTKTVANDIAILQTNETIPSDVKPICVAKESRLKIIKYKHATAMGWGYTNRNNTNIPETLQYVEQYTIDNFFCTFLGTKGVIDGKMCAKGVFKGICSGDSGGPLVHRSLIMPPVQIGIASHINEGEDCGKLTPAVFTDVGYHNAFIRESTDGDGVCYA